MQEIQMTRKTAAYKIHMDIMAAGEVAAEAFSTFCRLLKTMRDDKLWQELEYSSFEAYCQNAVGLKQAQAYAYIKAYEDFGDENSTRVEKLGIKKLKLLGTVPKENREEFMSDKNLEEMTTRQVEAAVKDYKEKLKKAEEESHNHIKEKLSLRNQLKNAQEQADKQSKWAGEHMRDRKIAEKKAADLQSETDRVKRQLGDKDLSIKILKQQLEKAKKDGDPAKVRELGQIISDKQQEIENYQQEIGKLNVQLQEKNKQLKEKPIEAAAIETVEKEVIPDEVRKAIYNKVTGLYEGVLKLTDREIQIFVEDVSSNYAEEVINGMYDAVSMLNSIKDKVSHNARCGDLNIPEGANCGQCKKADMDAVSQEDLDQDKTFCTKDNKVVDFDHACNKYKSYI